MRHFSCLLTQQAPRFDMSSYTLPRAFVAGLMVAMATGPVSARPPAPAPLQTAAIDHVGVAVRDLAQAKRNFEKLGFKVMAGGHFPGGLSNNAIFFDHFYLELLAVAPQHSKDVADIAEFAEKHEGAMFLGLTVASARATADDLRARNFDVTGPDPGSIMTGAEKKLPPPMWYDVSPSDKPAQGKKAFSLPIFFIQYLNPHRRDKDRANGALRHANTALSVQAVWIAVRNLQQQIQSLQDGGFSQPKRGVSLLGLRGRAVETSAGDINLLEVNDKTSPLFARGDHILGLSIAVTDVVKARTLLRDSAGIELPVYDGTYGHSILLPSESADGLRIELFQK